MAFRRTRSSLRLAREVYGLRDRAGGAARPYLVELATAVRSLLHAYRATRIALLAYRWGLRVLLVAGVALVLAGSAVELTWRDSWAGIVLGAVVIGGGGFALWWSWSLGRALRLLDAYADPSREVALRDLPERLAALAKAGEGLDVPRDLLRHLDEMARGLRGGG